MTRDDRPPRSHPGGRRDRFVAVIFDMDGVLTDTEVLWDEVRRGLAVHAGVPWPDDATTAMMGMSTPEWSAYLADVVGIPGTGPEVGERVIHALTQRYAAHLPVVPGAVDAVRRAARHHRLGLVSSSPRRLIDVSLQVMGIAELFEVTVSTEEVAAGKPAPDGYQRALELLGVDPADAVGVEDSTNGLRSLHAAGLTAIAVPPHFHPPAPEVLATAAVVINSLDELDDALLAGLSSTG